MHELTTRELIEESRRVTRRLARQSAAVLVVCMALVDLVVFKHGFFILYGVVGAAIILGCEARSRKTRPNPPKVKAGWKGG